MFMLVDVRGTGLSGYEFMRALYKSERVSVLDGAAFGRETAGFVRVCFATDGLRSMRVVNEYGASANSFERRGFRLYCAPFFAAPFPCGSRI